MTLEHGKIQEFITNLLKRHGDEKPFSDDDSLIKTGRLDSMDVMEVAFFLEENYGLDFKGKSVDETKLDSVNSIVQLIEIEMHK